MVPELAEQPESMLDHALAYLREGKPVFPVCSPAMGKHRHRVDGVWQDCTGDRQGKVPMVAWSDYQARLPAEVDVRDWWHHWPEANIGMATGAISGVVVLDADGTEARKAVMERGIVPTPSVWTGKPGGVHYWFRHPGVPIRNFARKLPGTDFRGDGGYVLLPPSLHVRGARYRWAEGTRGLALAPLPSWFESVQSTALAADERAPLDLQRFLDGIPEGERDDHLFRLASKLRGDDVPLPYAELLIAQAARLCRPPFDEATAVEKARRVYRDYPPGRGERSVLARGASAPQSVEALGQDAWNLISSVELMRLDLPEPKWAVPGIIPEGVFLVAGKPKFGKSWWALDLCAAVATGGMAWGRISVEQGEVLYISFEDSFRRLQDRVERVSGHRRGIAGLDLVTKCPRSNEGGIELVLSWVKSHPRARLIVIDPLEKWRAEEQEKKQLYRQDYESLQAIVELGRELGISVIVVHHCNKMPSPEDPFDAISGSTGLTGAADAIGVFRKEHGMADAVLFLKGKDVDFNELAFKSSVSAGPPAPAWELLGSGEVYRLSRERFETLQALWREPWQTPAQLAEVMDPSVSKGAMRKRLFDMARDGMLRVGEGKYNAAIDQDAYLRLYGHASTHGNSSNAGNAVTPERLSTRITDRPASKTDDIDVTPVTAVTSVTDVTGVTKKSDERVRVCEDCSGELPHPHTRWCNECAERRYPM